VAITAQQPTQGVKKRLNLGTIEEGIHIKDMQKGRVLEHWQHYSRDLAASDQQERELRQDKAQPSQRMEWQCTSHAKMQQEELSNIEKSCHEEVAHAANLHQRANLSRRPATSRGRRQYSPMLANL